MSQKLMTKFWTFFGVRFVFYPLFKFCYRLKVYGIENLPKQGGLIAANHASYFDPPMIGTAIYPRFLNYMARDTLFKPIGGWFLRHVGCHPVKRGKGNAAVFKLIPKLVKEGKLVVIFPEGTRTRDGEIHTGQPGAGLLVRMSHCPVIPTYVGGTYDAWNIHMKKPKLFGRTSVTFGKPLTFAHLAHLDKKTAQQKMVEETMRAIGQLKKQRDQSQEEDFSKCCKKY